MIKVMNIKEMGVHFRAIALFAIGQNYITRIENPKSLVPAKQKFHIIHISTPIESWCYYAEDRKHTNLHPSLNF